MRDWRAIRVRRTRENSARQAAPAKRGRMLDGYTPFQRVMICLSLTIIAISVILSAFYILNKYYRSPDPSEGDVPQTDPAPSGAQEETLPEDEDWDGVTLRPTADAGQSYVDETLFIGDSNFYRLVGYKLLTVSNVIGMSGKGIQSVMSEREVYVSGSSTALTAVEAAARVNPRRILMNFGTNNLTGNVDNFISVYRRTVEALQEACDADVIVMSVPPLAREIGTEYGRLTMDEVNSFNEGLRAMCLELGIMFLNVTDDCLKDPETGFGRSSYMYEDGIHLELKGLQELLNYYRTHALKSDDRRTSATGASIVRHAEKFDCDSVVSDVCIRLISAGYTMATNSEEGVSSSVTYEVPADETSSNQSVHAENIAARITSSFSKSARIRITWADDSSGNHIFTLTGITPCETHSYGDWTVVNAATCSAGGSRKHVCTVCGHEETEDIPADGESHSYEWTTVREARCDAPGERTGKCKYCSKETTEEVIVDHTPTVSKERLEPTCTEAGHTEETVCSICGQLINAMEEIPALGHDYTYVTDKEPTETEAGHRTGTCTRCGAIVGEDIPPTGGGG